MLRGRWHRRLVPFVYILRCADESLYVGLADDVEARLVAHNDGRFGGYTARRRPVMLIHLEEFTTFEDASARERQLKGWTRAKKEALVRGDLDTLKELSRRRT